ncbi:MAG: tetratricopeptide repeat protein [Spirochaetaceae bacterium]|jgi:tetratricopeptide (TPR) repeat protein|nr:tetratricopeptide repeat protein [Spirochaetaceae bacterium]
MKQTRFILAVVLSAFFASAATAQQPKTSATPYSIDDRIENGIALYEQGLWGEAIGELRRVMRDTGSREQQAEALFWVAMSELARGEYESAIYDLDDIRRIDSASIRVADVPYHKARALFSLKRYNEAVRFFEEYEKNIRIDGRSVNAVRYDNLNDTQFAGLQIEYNKKAAALYWIGECYYFMEDYDRALGYYTLIVDQYMKSHKYESSMNRISLIKQKKIENDLRDEIRTLLKPEPAPPVAAGEPATGGPSYDEAILLYQNRIAPYLLLKALGEDTKKEASPAAPAVAQSQPPPSWQTAAPGKNDDHDVTKRLLTIKTDALSLMERLLSTLTIYENFEIQRW